VKEARTEARFARLFVLASLLSRRSQLIRGVESVEKVKVKSVTRKTTSTFDV
jgi:hypothetical protein